MIAAWYIQLAKAETALSHNPLPSISVFDQKSRVGGAEQRARRRRRRRRRWVGVLARPRKFVRSLEAARFTFALFDMCASERESALARSPAPALSVRRRLASLSPLGSLCNAARRENGENCFLGRFGHCIASGGFAFCTRPCMKWGYGGGELSFIWAQNPSL